MYFYTVKIPVDDIIRRMKENDKIKRKNQKTASEASRKKMYFRWKRSHGKYMYIVECKTRILELFKLELWDIMSQKLLVSSQNMSVFGWRG